jgi:hypothetical protein
MILVTLPGEMVNKLHPDEGESGDAYHSHLSVLCLCMLWRHSQQCTDREFQPAHHILDTVFSFLVLGLGERLGLLI